MKKILLTSFVFLLASKIAISAGGVKGKAEAIIAINSESLKRTNMQIPCVHFVNRRTLTHHDTCGFDTFNESDSKIARYYKIYRLPVGVYTILNYSVVAPSQNQYFSSKTSINFDFTTKPDQVTYLGAWRSEPLDFVEGIFSYTTKSAGVSVRDLIKTDEPLIRKFIKDETIPIVNLTEEILNKPNIPLINGVLFDEGVTGVGKMVAQNASGVGFSKKNEKISLNIADVPDFVKGDKLSAEYVGEKLKIKASGFFNEFKKNFGIAESAGKKVSYILKSDKLDPGNKYTRNQTIQYTPIDGVIGYEKFSSKDRFPFNSIPDFEGVKESRITLRGLFEIDSVYSYQREDKTSRQVTVDFEYEFNGQSNEFVIKKEIIDYELKGDVATASKRREKTTCFKIDSEELADPVKYKEPVMHFNCSTPNEIPEIIVFLRNSQIFALERKTSFYSSKLYEVEVRVAN